MMSLFVLNHKFLKGESIYVRSIGYDHAITFMPKYATLSYLGNNIM